MSDEAGWGAPQGTPTQHPAERCRGADAAVWRTIPKLRLAATCFIDFRTGVWRGSVQARGLREDDLPTLARWEMDPGRMATASNWVVPPSEAAAKERITKWCANDKDDLG